MDGRLPAGDRGVDDVDGVAVGSSVAEAECVRSDGEAVECTLSLPDDLAGELDDFCREQYLHREAAVRSLLAEWLDGRSVE
ncbi:hypothetical protein C479_02186 [Halovivax asiaticus JCM 14624]|uniref:Ribbon-helix-helix protein CopG domain-containing protein n=1 Tax=Halovivax asiaticus JCM 14624 TaxID=1227490 RepID=M0BRI5_9EURY|nr:hypothetical protein [Halovivax asiaticus]ELZ13616.1 hypothetical protein C479_02186 [Halovivax asiaticus JCM 14624]